METSHINVPEKNTEEKAKSKFPCCEAFKSKKFKIAAMVVGVFLIFLIGFASGVAVGIHKARFSYRFGENYERNFMGSRRGMDWSNKPIGMMGQKVRDFEGRDFINGHGLAGTIISITDNNLVIKDRDNRENTVAVSDKTIIKSGRDDIKIGDLKNNEQVAVVGSPGDNGVINAELIRVFSNDNTNSNNANSNGGTNNIDTSNNGN